MNSKSTMNRAPLAGIPVIGATILAAALTSSRVEAGQPAMMETMPPAESPAWKWGISADYMYRSVDRSEDYFSGPELWHVDYDDFDGDLWGFSAFITPPRVFGMTLDFSYRTGDLDGSFTNYSLAPNPLDPFTYANERASFDRNEYEVGLTYPFPGLDWLYARAEWFQYDEEGEWTYSDGTIEAQDYNLWGITAGLGAKYGMPLGNSRFTLDLNAFAGLVYFESEHEEIGGPTTSWDGWGFKGRLGARLSYPIVDRLDVFLGSGYEYLDTSDGSLDMENQGLFVNLGIKGEF